MVLEAPSPAGRPAVRDAVDGGGPEPRVSLIRRVVDAAAPGAVDLALGLPRHPVPPPVRRALARAAREEELDYTTNAGRRDLRRAVAARRPHHGTSGDSVIVTVGSQQALALALLGRVRPGDEVVIPELAYPSYRFLAERAGAAVVRAAPSDLPEAVTRRTRLVLVASPANPTGEVLPRDVLDALAGLADERGFDLLSDEVYEEIWLGAERPAVPAGERVVHVGGISKTLAAPGLRLGWLVAAPEVVARLLPLHQHLVTCAPALSQAAALAGLALPPAELEAVRDHYRRRWRRLRALLAELPEGVRWRAPGGAFYAWLDVRERAAGDTVELALELARRGEVLVVPGEAFGPAGRGHLRLTFSGPEGDLEEGVRRLAAALAAR